MAGKLIPDFRRRDGKWAVAKRVNGAQVFTTGGRCWNNMSQRCRTGGAKQQQRPTYTGVSHTFSDYHDFIGWAQTQIGYGLDGWALDKDLLVKGNKIYSKDFAVFLPAEINSFLIKQESTRGDLPIGVTFDKERSKFAAQMFKENKRVHLGRFESPIDAFLAYKQNKEAYAKELAHRWAGQIDPRAWAALLSYKVEFND